GPGYQGQDFRTQAPGRPGPAQGFPPVQERPGPVPPGPGAGGPGGPGQFAAEQAWAGQYGPGWTGAEQGPVPGRGPVPGQAGPQGPAQSWPPQGPQGYA